MRKLIALLLACILCFSCIGCGKSDNPGEDSSKNATAPSFKDVQMYAPGTVLETDFGSIMIMDVAFCEKAQIYYIKNSRATKTTINGQTTESYEEFIHPGYISMMDQCVIFALKTVLTNKTTENLELQKLEAKAYFQGDKAVYFTTGGNYDISDSAYSVLPAGATGEYIFAALLPIEQYQNAAGCLLEVGGAELGFANENIHVYNALGFQPEDNVTVGIEQLLQKAGSSAKPAVEETEAAVQEPKTVKYYREAEKLPTVDSVTNLEMYHSAYDSSNGTITRMRYYYRASKDVKKAPEMIDQYLAYLKEHGYTVQEDGINVSVSLNGVSLASIQITGTSMEVGIDTVPGNTVANEVREVKKISAGETVKLDFLEMKINGVYHGPEIREDDGRNTYHRRANNSNNQMFWLETTMKNVGTNTFGLWGLRKYYAEIVFDGKYTYEASIDKMVGMGNSELTPFESAKVYVYAEIPKEMLNQYSNVVVRFAFNDYFEKADNASFDTLKNRFEFSQ